MKINYIYGRSLAARLPGLTYIELRDMLPRVTSKEGLPAANTRHAQRDINRFLRASDGDITITVFRDGVYLYEEGNRLASDLVNEDYTSVLNGEEALEREAISHCEWYLPLMIAGQARVKLNTDKDQYKIRQQICLNTDSLMDLMEGHIYMGEDSSLYQSETEILQKVRERLEAAKGVLSKRQEDVIYRMDECSLTRNQTAKELNVTPQCISKTRSRGLARMKDALENGTV